MKRFIFIVVLLTILLITSTTTVCYATIFLIDQQLSPFTHSMVNMSSENKTRMFAQSFIPTQNHISAVSSPLQTFDADIIRVEIRPDNNGFPSDTILGFSTTRIGNPPIYSGIIFEPHIALIPNETYYLVAFKNSDYLFTSPSINYEAVSDGNLYPNGQAYYKEQVGPWVIGVPYSSYESGDYIFKTYYSPEVIPEPSTVLLFGFGLICAGLRKRRS